MEGGELIDGQTHAERHEEGERWVFRELDRHATVKKKCASICTNDRDGRSFLCCCLFSPRKKNIIKPSVPVRKGAAGPHVLFLPCLSHGKGLSLIEWMLIDCGSIHFLQRNIWDIE